MSIYYEDDDGGKLIEAISDISETLSGISADTSQNTEAIERLSASICRLERRLEMLGVFFAENLHQFTFYKPPKGS